MTKLMTFGTFFLVGLAKGFAFRISQEQIKQVFMCNLLKGEIRLRRPPGQISQPFLFKNDEK